MKKFFEDFKAFAMRGNVIDMAVGVIIGAAFGSITTSLVNDIFMPLLGLLTGGLDFSTLTIKLASDEASRWTADHMFPLRRPRRRAWARSTTACLSKTSSTSF